MNDSVDVFSVRDLRIRSNQYLKDAEMGRLSVVTKHGKPKILGIPFDKKLLDLGIDKDIAVLLFENNAISLKKAAKMVLVSLEEFIELLSGSGIDVVKYSTEELDSEMKTEF